MPRTYEVIPQIYDSRGRSWIRTYVTGHGRSQEARWQAEERMRLERNGELRRQELKRQAEEVQDELRSLARRLARIEQDHKILDSALKPFPQNAPALERWLAEATVLRDGVAQAMPALIQAWERSERERRAEEERRQRDEEGWLACGVELTAMMLRGGARLSSDQIREALDDAACLECQYGSVIPEQELDLFEEAWEREYRFEEMLDWYDRDQHPFVTPRLTKVERDTLELRKYRRGPGKRHRRGLDPDKRRKWRKEVYSMVA